MTASKQVIALKQYNELLTQFIVRLTVFYQGYSDELDAELSTLRSHLSGQANYSLAQVSITKLSPLLSTDTQLLQQIRSSSVQQIEDAVQQVLPHVEHEASMRRLAGDVVAQARQPSQNLHQLLQLCLRTVALYKGFSQAQPAPQAANDAQSGEAEQLMTSLREELAELLLSYRRQHPGNTQLSALSQQIADGLSSEALLNVCLAILRLVVKDSMHEAVFSGKVINSIHAALGSLNHCVSSSIDLSKESFDAHQTAAKRLRGQLSTFADMVKNSQTLEGLKQVSQQQLEAVGTTLQQGQQVDAQHQQALMAQLNSMRAQLDELQKQTDFYRKKLARQTQASQTDPLTQLPNRQAYDELIKSLTQSVDAGSPNLALAIMDIDHFKSVNDRFGHAAGDKTLQIVGKKVKEALAPEDFIARWGGEEFVLVIPGTDREQLFCKLEELRTRVTRLPFKFKQQRVTVTASFGGACFCHGEKPEEVFERADQHLYKAKKAGRNCVVIDQDDV